MFFGWVNTLPERFLGSVAIRAHFGSTRTIPTELSDAYVVLRYRCLVRRFRTASRSICWRPCNCWRWRSPPAHVLARNARLWRRDAGRNRRRHRRRPAAGSRFPRLPAVLSGPSRGTAVLSGPSRGTAVLSRGSTPNERGRLAAIAIPPYVVPPPLLVTRYSASFLKATDLIAPIRTSRMAYGPFWHSLIYNALGSQPGARPAATQKNAGVKAVRAGGRCGLLSAL